MASSTSVEDSVEFDVCSTKPSTSTPVERIQQTIKTDNFFNELFEYMYDLNLKYYWCRQNYVDNNNYIIFAQFKLVNEVPVLVKEVVFKDNLELIFYIDRKIISFNNLPKYACSLSMLEETLDTFYEYNICKGGPTSNNYKELLNIVTSASIDESSNTWRHKNCTYIVEQSSVCPYCITLFKNFKRRIKTVDRKRKFYRACPSFKREKLILKKSVVKKRLTNSQVKNLKTRLNILQNKINLMEKKCSFLNEGDLNEILRNTCY